MTYTPELLAHYKEPHNRGSLPAATHSHTVRNPLCGDEITLELRIVDGAVVDVAFDGVGCAISIASASIQTEAWAGRSQAELAASSDDEAVQALGVPIAPARRACAGLIVQALHGAMTAP